MNIKDQLEQLMHNVADDLKGRWDFYRHAAYLKKMGWTEEQYQRYNDPGYNNRATRIKDIYHGYPYQHMFTTTRGDPWTQYLTWLECLSAITVWCDENCTGRWRHDIHRVIKTASTSNEWQLNEIGGGDALFFAFERIEDLFLFKLKWGGE